MGRSQYVLPASGRVSHSLLSGERKLKQVMCQQDQYMTSVVSADVTMMHVSSALRK